MVGAECAFSRMEGVSSSLVVLKALLYVTQLLGCLTTDAKSHRIAEMEDPELLIGVCVNKFGICLDAKAASFITSRFNF
jgi:hypothetical protein